MKQMKSWMLATILTSCGLMVLSSCSNEDNPEVSPVDETELQIPMIVSIILKILPRRAKIQIILYSVEQKIH